VYFFYYPFANCSANCSTLKVVSGSVALAVTVLVFTYCTSWGTFLTALEYAIVVVLLSNELPTSLLEILDHKYLTYLTLLATRQNSLCSQHQSSFAARFCDVTKDLLLLKSSMITRLVFFSINVQMYLLSSVAFHKVFFPNDCGWPVLF
jgi:hypothetical protein